MAGASRLGVNSSPPCRRLRPPWKHPQHAFAGQALGPEPGCPGLIGFVYWKVLTAPDIGDYVNFPAPGLSASNAAYPPGCSLEQFCAAIPATTSPDKLVCMRSDWKNDEPIMMREGDRDCTFEKGGRGKDGDRCVPYVK